MQKRYNYTVAVMNQRNPLLSQILERKTINRLTKSFRKPLFDQPVFVIIKVFVIDRFIEQLVKFRSSVMLAHKKSKPASLEDLKTEMKRILDLKE